MIEVSGDVRGNASDISDSDVERVYLRYNNRNNNRVCVICVSGGYLTRSSRGGVIRCMSRYIKVANPNPPLTRSTADVISEEGELMRGREREKGVWGRGNGVWMCGWMRERVWIGRRCIIERVCVVLTLKELPSHQRL